MSKIFVTNKTKHTRLDIFPYHYVAVPQLFSPFLQNMLESRKKRNNNKYGM